MTKPAPNRTLVCIVLAVVLAMPACGDGDKTLEGLWFLDKVAVFQGELATRRDPKYPRVVPDVFDDEDGDGAPPPAETSDSESALLTALRDDVVLDLRRDGSFMLTASARFGGAGGWVGLHRGSWTRTEDGVLLSRAERITSEWELKQDPVDIRLMLNEQGDRLLFKLGGIEEPFPLRRLTDEEGP